MDIVDLCPTDEQKKSNNYAALILAYRDVKDGHASSSSRNKLRGTGESE
jgi:hypothetical protein